MDDRRIELVPTLKVFHRTAITRRDEPQAVSSTYLVGLPCRTAASYFDFLTHLNAGCRANPVDTLQFRHAHIVFLRDLRQRVAFAYDMNGCGGRFV